MGQAKSIQVPVVKTSWALALINAVSFLEKKM